MRVKFLVAAVLSLSLMVPTAVWADEIDDIMSEIESEDGPAESTDPGEAEEQVILPEIGDEDQLALFVLDRGYYFTSDMGVFINFGGTRGNSNLQPFTSIAFGRDFGEYYSLQFTASQGYVSQNPLTANDDASQTSTGNMTADYSLSSFTLDNILAIRPSARFAIELSAGPGVTRLNPDLTAANATAANAGSQPSWAFHMVEGIDLKYLTLLTDFTAGISLNLFTVFVKPVIVGVSASAAVRYTF